MKCYVCGSIIGDDAGKCPVCGFVFPRRVGDMEAYDRMMREIAKEYRKQHMIAAKIGMKAYFYAETEDGSIDLREEREIILCEDISQAKRGEILWNPQKFGALEAGRPMTLYVFRRQGVETKSWKVDLTAPETKGCWQVGIRVEDGLRFRVFVGDQENHTESDDLLIME